MRLSALLRVSSCGCPLQLGRVKKKASNPRKSYSSHHSPPSISRSPQTCGSEERRPVEVVDVLMRLS